MMIDERFHKLGLGATHPVKVPTLVPSFDSGTPIVSLACGASHSMAVVEFQGKGNVLTWGNNFYGQCAHMSENTSYFSLEDEEDEITTPSLVASLSSIESQPTPTPTSKSTHRLQLAQEKKKQSSDINSVKVAASNFQSVALTQDGSLYTWGGGILGHGAEVYDSNPMKITFFNDIQRQVVDVVGGGDVVAVQCRPFNSHLNEVYIFGYVNDDQGRAMKCLSPCLVKHALVFQPEKIAVAQGRGAYAGYGTWAIMGQDMDSPFTRRLYLFGKPSTLEQLAHPQLKDTQKGIWSWLMTSWSQSQQERNVTQALDAPIEPPDYPFMRDLVLVHDHMYTWPCFMEIELKECGNVVGLSLGQGFGVVWNDQGHVWGFNHQGECRLLTDKYTMTHVEIAGNQDVVGLCDEGHVYMWKSPSNPDMLQHMATREPTLLYTNTSKWLHLSVGFDHGLCTSL